MKTRTTRMMVDTRSFSSRYPNGMAMYPGKYRCMWIDIGGVWFMVAMEPENE